MASKGDVCYCFSYASNMLMDLMTMHTPSARNPRVGILKGYCFSFETSVIEAEGRGTAATATIMEGSPADLVYGVVCDLSVKDLENLDRHETGYMGIKRDIEMADGSTLPCRLFQMIGEVNGNQHPYPCYKGAVLDGAKQNGLPEEYIRFLDSFPDSGESIIPPILQKFYGTFEK